LSSSSQLYVKSELVPLLAVVHGDAATIVGTILSAVLTAGGIVAWPQLVPRLIEYLDAARDEDSVVAAMQAVVIICEDCGRQLDALDAGRPIDALMPRLLALVRAPHPKVRELAVRSVNCFIGSSPLALMANLGEYLESLFILTGDTDPRIRTLVCVAFHRFAELHADQLVPHIVGIIQFIVHASQDVAAPDVQLAATQFWISICRSGECAAFVVPYLGEIVPVLLANLVYSPAELAALPMQRVDDAAVPDDPRDVRPHVSQGRHAFAGGDDDDEDGDDEDDEDEQGGAALEQGGDAPTVRRASGRALDFLSRHAPDEVLEVLLPLLNVCFTSGDWLRIESAILAIGAISDGCFVSMSQHLPHLVPFLLTQTDSEHVLLRTITVWTLSRYSKWIVGQREPKRYLEPTLNSFLVMAVESSKVLQSSGISALAVLIEVARYEMLPYIVPLTLTLMKAFRMYQKRNRSTCYDAISTLANALVETMRSQELVDIIMPSIAARWAEMDDDDDDDGEVYSMYDCLIELTHAFGPLLGEFVAALVQRSTALAQRSLATVQAYEDHRKQSKQNGQQPTMTPPNHALLICGIDLLSSAIEAVGEGVAPLLDASVPSIAVGAMRLPLFDVRSSTAALIGDLAVYAPALIAPALNDVVPLLLHNIREDLIAPFGSLINNAVWSLGEIALLLRESFAPAVEQVLERVVPILLDDTTNTSILHNCAVCISRASIHHAVAIAPHVGQFLKPWCYALRRMEEGSERQTAYAGLCCVVEQNPRDVMPDFVYVADAIAAYTQPPPQLEATFRSLLTALRDAYGDHWNAYYANYPPDLRQRLDTSYFR
jgi:transportin-1